MKDEIRYIIYAIVFAFITFGFLIPKLIEGGIQDSNPYLQFLIFNVGIFIFLQIFLKSIATGMTINVREILGIMFLFMATDTLSPPLLVTTSGQLSGNVILYSSAIDYILGSLAINLGLSGFLVYLFVYIFAPFVLLLLSSILLKNFVKAL